MSLDVQSFHFLNFSKVYPTELNMLKIYVPEPYVINNLNLTINQQFSDDGKGGITLQKVKRNISS